jgi:hypothetical protein
VPVDGAGRRAAAAALADVRHVPFWLDGPQPEPEPALVDDTTTDLAVVGAGYTGLWTALLAKERDPGRDVVVLEARTAGWAASGRNGGFCAASLTHGLRNGLERFPDEMPTLERLGRENLDAIDKAVADHGIACSWERTGELTVATARPGRSTPSPSCPGSRGGSAPTSSGWGATTSAAGSRRRPTSGASSTVTASPWSTRPGWPRAFARPACA